MMIKNSEILERFERDEVNETPDPWYQKADVMYKFALKLNSDAVKNGGDEHLKMLIDVRKKNESR